LNKNGSALELESQEFPPSDREFLGLSWVETSYTRNGQQGWLGGYERRWRDLSDNLG
jgi:hypothetical protein